jgi:hypothetical protein
MRGRSQGYIPRSRMRINSENSDGPLLTVPFGIYVRVIIVCTADWTWVDQYSVLLQVGIKKGLLGQRLLRSDLGALRCVVQVHVAYPIHSLTKVVDQGTYTYY